MNAETSTETQGSSSSDAGSEAASGGAQRSGDEKPERGAARESSRPSRGLRVFIVAAAVVLVAATAGGFYLLGSESTQEDEEPNEPLRVEVIAAERVGGYTVRRSYTGRVQARRSSMVGFELGGKLIELSFDDGDSVDAGEEVARLDTVRLEARRRELVAAAAEASARAELVRGRFERTQRAFDRDAATDQELDERRDELAAAETALQRAREAVRSVEVDIAKSVLSAPFDAVIARRTVDEGEVLAAGTPVYELLDRASPEARVGAPAAVAESLAVGDSASVRVRGRAIVGRVLALLPVTQRGTRTIEVVIDLDAELDGLRDGDLAGFEAERRIDSAGFWLPMEALTASARGLWSVMVAVERDGDDANGEAERVVEFRQLEMLHTDGDRVFVDGTLADGELVIVSGTHRLVADDAVAVERETAIESEASATGRGPRRGSSRFSTTRTCCSSRSSASSSRACRRFSPFRVLRTHGSPTATRSC